MPERDDDLLIQDIIASCKNIFAYTNSLSFHEFLEEQKTLDAVSRNFEIIGEAAKRVSIKIKESNPEIAWKQMSAFRDVLIHNYFGINYKIVWEIIQNDLPGQNLLLEKLYKSLTISPE